MRSFSTYIKSNVGHFLGHSVYNLECQFQIIKEDFPLIKQDSRSLWKFVTTLEYDVTSKAQFKHRTFHETSLAAIRIKIVLTQ